MAKSEPRDITSIRRAIDESRLADISSGALENARTWAITNDDGVLLVDIEDELGFRGMPRG